MEKRLDIMVDLETLGLGDDATIIQIAALAFDITNGEIIDSFEAYVDIAKTELNADGSTIKWWLGTDKELFTDLILNGQVPLESALEDFSCWINGLSQSEDDPFYKDIFLWGNGILFDNAKLKTQFEKHDQVYPIFYRNDRDVRTILELAIHKLGIKEKELRGKLDKHLELKFKVGLTKHDALDDAHYQVELVTFCYNILMGKDFE
jgi:DNA polymerase III alpha subunit (gram-positive type)